MLIYLWFWVLILIDEEIRILESCIDWERDDEIDDFVGLDWCYTQHIEYDLAMVLAYL